MLQQAAKISRSVSLVHRSEARLGELLPPDKEEAAAAVMIINVSRQSSSP
jgi:hypothetical protein